MVAEAVDGLGSDVEILHDAGRFRVNLVPVQRQARREPRLVVAVQHAVFGQRELGHHAGALAVGAKVAQIKVGGGTDGAHYGWSAESVVNALEWINAVAVNENPMKGRIAAVTLSVSGDPREEGAPCTGIGQAIDAAAAKLNDKGIAVVMAAGNDGTSGLGSWNCGSHIVTVGATRTLAPGMLDSYSNHAASTRLYAPVGEGNHLTRDGILAPYKDAGTLYVSGTSFAAPQVAGAYAVLREKFGAQAPLEELTTRLWASGHPLTDPKAPSTARQIDIPNALSSTE